MYKLPVYLFIFCGIFVSCSSKSKTEGLVFTTLSTTQSGINFTNTITESDSLNLLIHEYTYMGGGVGVGDFNNDKLPDLFFSGNQKSSALYINKGNLQFEDITQKAGMQTTGWCTGVSVVDINQDGWQDIYVCVSGTVPATQRKNLLFINQHDLSFKEQAEAYGLADTSFSTQGVFFDYDKDGDLDMYLANLLLKGDYRNTIKPKRTDGRSLMADVLFRNEGIPAGMDHPVYKDVTTAAGIADNAYGLGLAVSDLDGDSYPDIYVANDYLSNDLLWMNNKNGTFANCIATAMGHQSYSSMGTDIADFNNDGLPDVATLDMQPETNERKKMMFSFLSDVRYKLERDAGYEPQLIRNMLHLNNGVRNMPERKEPFFSEIGQMSGISETDWSWSVLIADFDNDGWKDMHITNGMGRDVINADFVAYRKEPAYKADEITAAAQQRHLVEKLASYGTVPLQNYFYHNKGDLTFEDISSQAGITDKTISNGAAYADLDNDGDLDLIINNINTPSAILRNDMVKTKAQHYLAIALQGKAPNKDGFGTKVIVHTGSATQLFEQYPVRGYLSSVDQRIHIGLGSQLPDSVTITWPDNVQQVLIKPAADTLLVIKQEDANIRSNESTLTAAALFTDITAQFKLPYRHMESFFYDYGFQTLLPQKYSQEGPFISAGDLNGDGLEDFFIGGAYNQSGKIFLQQSNGNYTGSDLVKGEKEEEDMQSLLFDADGDKDLDIFMVSGSSEFDNNSPFYKPRLYLNDGKGKFSPDSTAIPENVLSPAKSIAGADIDNDGDTDLFIGGRVLVGNYPKPPRSFLLRNDHGKFTDITPPALQYPGLLNAASWADIDNDKIPELILAGEWMPVRIFKNAGGSFSEITAACGIDKLKGFWRSLTISDIDGDGDMDLLAGNLGKNNPYRISPQQPAKLIALDYDGNGVVEPIICYYIRKDRSSYEESVGISRDKWAMQAPSIKKKFDQNQAFALSTINQIVSDDEMKRADIYECNEDASGYFENDGKGHFTFHAFSILAQIAPVNTILSADVDGDGKKDILLGGNEYEYNVAVGRMDALYGLLLKGDGKGGFTPVPPVTSGWITSGDIRDSKLIQNKVQGRILLIARNNDSLQLIKLKN